MCGFTKRESSEAMVVFWRWQFGTTAKKFVAWLRSGE